jgi:hypothetical protein
VRQRLKVVTDRYATIRFWVDRSRESNIIDIARRALSLSQSSKMFLFYEMADYNEY